MDSIQRLAEIGPELETDITLRRERLNRGKGRIVKVERAETAKNIKGVLEAMGSDDFDEAIRARSVSFGLVKPHITFWGDRTELPRKETDALQTILGYARERIDVPMAMNVCFDREAVLAFRKPKKTSMRRLRSRLAFPSVWEEEQAVLLSGAVTPLVVHGENAVPRWRSIVGSSNPAEAEPDTIRGRWGRKITNNIVHGSDGVDYGCPYTTVKNEIACWMRVLEEMTS